MTLTLLLNLTFSPNRELLTMKNRRPSGSAITEMGPALFVLVILFFPMLDLVQMGASYALANTYNQTVSREIAFLRPELATQAINTVNAGIDANALYRFLRIVTRRVDSVQFLNLANNPVTLPAANDTSNAANNTRRNIAKVRVTTTMIVTPFVTCPFFNNVPGVSAPLPFVCTSDRPQDEKGLN